MGAKVAYQPGRNIKMPESTGIPPFKAFIDGVSKAKHADYAATPMAKVAHEDAFTEMQAHILKLYDKTEVQHSFVDENGSIFDCIPIEQQPSLKGTSGPIPKAPDLPKHEPAPSGPRDEKKDVLIATPMGPDRKDRHGNLMHCPEGTIPMRRITLENMVRFGTLKDFFRKGPGEVRPPISSPSGGIAPGVPATHRWAHAYQNVNNGGGHSFLNIWDPAIGANQVFSLSQHWYVGGSGAGLQTAECGWQVYPQMYGNTKPVFFIYYTADDYNTTGCYNLTCNAFVHTAGSFTPGMAFNAWSVTGGSQYIVELAYWHTGGRWWLYVNGTSGSNAIGYYPDSVYKGGALTQHATEIDYGGETVGTTTFPPMGSGAFANAGWQKAAYQHTLQYYPPAGGTVTAKLTAVQSWPKCYTAVVAMSGDPWYETLWFGGPGGAC
jgi:neprosin-like protein